MAFQPPGYCPNCGEYVEAGAVACEECGSCAETGWNEEEEVYDGLDLPSEPENELPRKSRGLGGALLTAALIVLLVYVFVFR